MREPRQSWQQNEYNQLQGSKPCCYRGELEKNSRHEPASACCKAKEIVLSAKFYCKFHDKYIISSTTCWTCSDQKATLPDAPPSEPN